MLEKLHSAFLIALLLFFLVLVFVTAFSVFLFSRNVRLMRRNQQSSHRCRSRWLSRLLFGANISILLIGLIQPSLLRETRGNKPSLRPRSHPHRSSVLAHLSLDLWAQVDEFLWAANLTPVHILRCQVEKEKMRRKWHKQGSGNEGKQSGLQSEQNRRTSSERVVVVELSFKSSDTTEGRWNLLSENRKGNWMT